jgi:hypothetical protein
VVGGNGRPLVDLVVQHRLVQRQIKRLADAYVVERLLVPHRLVVADGEEGALMEVGASLGLFVLRRRSYTLIQLAVQIVGILGIGSLVDLEVYLAQLGLGEPEVVVADQIQVALVVPDSDLELVAAEPAGLAGDVVDPVFIAELGDQLLGLSKGGRIAERLQEVRRRSPKFDDQGLAIRHGQRIPDQRRNLACDSNAIGSALLRREGCGVFDGIQVVGDDRADAGVERSVDRVSKGVGIDGSAIAPLEPWPDLERVTVSGRVKRGHRRGRPRYDIAVRIKFDHTREGHVNGEVRVVILDLGRIQRLDVNGRWNNRYCQDLLGVW